MITALDELINNRQDLIEVHRKNNFAAGIHVLLTVLYPDTPHFIYELLQNAEDMYATIPGSSATRRPQQTLYYPYKNKPFSLGERLVSLKDQIRIPAKHWAAR
jgi:hypothetical protein